MQIYINKYNPQQDADCLILPVSPGKQQALITTEFNNHHNNIIDELITNKDLTGKYGEIKWLYNICPNIKIIIAVGVGESKKLSTSSFINLVNLALDKLTDRPYSRVINGLADISFPKDYLNFEFKHLAWKLSQILIATESFTNLTKTYLSGTNIKNTKLAIQSYYVASSALDLSEGYNDNFIKHQHIISRAIRTVKDLANTPANICNPEYLEQQAIELANKYNNIKCQSFGHKTLCEMGMGAFCSVSQGADHSGRMVVLEYNNSHNSKPYVLIGKGITFDTGGYSLKTPNHMVGMKYDMSGAANVIGTLQAIAELDLPIHVIGILACAENMVSNTASRPDDIVTTLSGKTVEINNTDAEGRLVLCDALTYSERFKPKVIIDIATLTGAVVVALGYHYTGLYSNNDTLTKNLISASEAGFDPVWPMPLCQDYDSLMTSPIADLKNSSGLPVAGSITAACFLANFVPKDCAWAHLDIAGSATVRSEHKESTGRPLQLLVNYLIAEAK
ncbi:MAG: leucyl aminopeptidase [Gammaproteobacteria bacterium]|nr:leucyl aminopeptidase [Gammaproteobacteria bacterium]